MNLRILKYKVANTNTALESDIRGANSYESPLGINWQSILVRSGVYTGGDPAWKPRVIVDDVHDAVQWAVKDAESYDSTD